MTPAEEQIGQLEALVNDGEQYATRLHELAHHFVDHPPPTLAPWQTIAQANELHLATLNIVRQLRSMLGELQRGTK